MSLILVVLERQGAGWHRLSWEALAAGQQLAADLGFEVAAAVVGAGPDGAEAAAHGAKSVFAVEHELLSQYTADAYAAAVDQLVRRTNPEYVLFPHTYQVRDFAPRVAARFHGALLSDVIGHRVDAGRPIFLRQLFQGKLHAEYEFSGPAPRFLSIQAGSYRAAETEQGAPAATVEKIPVEIRPEEVRVRPEAPFRESARAVDLTAADIIVAVGRGIREKENLPLVQALAEALGGELAASRPICDNGWLPMERQVGSSGQTVAPKLYVAVGISGAIQHLVGMKGSRTIVAINKDEHAPIFEVADYGIVGDLFEVVPALTEQIRRLKSENR